MDGWTSTVREGRREREIKKCVGWVYGLDPSFVYCIIFVRVQTGCKCRGGLCVLVGGWRVEGG